MLKFWNLNRRYSPDDSGGITRMADLIDPEVMADLIIEKMKTKIAIIPYAKPDTTLQGRPGTTVQIPVYSWDGEATEVAEGEEIPIRKLGSKTEPYTVKKAGIGTEITDEALESGLGDPVGVSVNGITSSILAKTDIDAMQCLLSASTVYDATRAASEANRVIGYVPVVKAIDLFVEEENTDKVLFIHPHQVTTLRLDPKFQSKETYDATQVVVTGEIGMISGAHVKVSARVPAIGGCYFNPIVKLNVVEETESDLPALTYYLKRATNVERERKARRRLWEITGDQMYLVALTNDSRVVVLKTSDANLEARKMYDHTYIYPGTEYALDTTGVRPTIEKTGSAAYTLNLAGKAPLLDETARDGLGFNALATNEAVVLVGIPNAPLHGFEASEVYYNGVAMTAKDVQIINGAPFLVIVRAMWFASGAITGASESFTVKYGATGTENTFTWSCKGLELA